MIFDKTGTLTKGEPVLVDASDADALRLAAAVEGDSEHPLARAIVDGAKDRGLSIPAATAFEPLGEAPAQVGARRLPWADLACSPTPRSRRPQWRPIGTARVGPSST